MESSANITPTWQSFFDLRDQIVVPDDFMSERDDGAPQDRVLFQ
jgi:hypothetical protein